MRYPKAYHSAGLRWGTVTSKFYETRDNLWLGSGAFLARVNGIHAAPRDVLMRTKAKALRSAGALTPSLDL